MESNTVSRSIAFARSCAGISHVLSDLCQYQDGSVFSASTAVGFQANETRKLDSPEHFLGGDISVSVITLVLQQRARLLREVQGLVLLPDLDLDLERRDERPSALVALEGYLADRLLAFPSVRVYYLAQGVPDDDLRPPEQIARHKDLGQLVLMPAVGALDRRP